MTDTTGNSKATGATSSGHDAGLKSAAKTMELGAWRIVLAVALLMFLASLFVLPHAADLPAWKFLLRTGEAQSVGIVLPEFIYLLLMTVGMGMLTTMTLITRWAAPGLAAWMMITVSFFCSVFVYWMRETSAYPVQVGLYVGMVSAFIGMVSYSFVALRRSPEQAEAEARIRAQGVQLDEVGLAQSRSATVTRQQENPLLIDDRRQRAAERHRRSE